MIPSAGHAKHEAYKALENTTSHLGPCCRIQRASLRFWVSISAENCRLHEEILIDIIYLKRNPDFHIVNLCKDFNGTIVITGIQISALSKTALRLSATACTGMPCRML